MARVHERVFAWVAVLVVIISAGALSGAFIIQELMSSSAQDSSASSQNIDQSALGCTDSDTEPTFAVPAKFLASNDITKLVTTDLKVGNGRAANSGDCLVVKYYGTLAKDGTMFDENYTKPTAFAFRLGQGQVIPGWDEGLVGMKVGGERRLVIPAELGYGAQGNGSIPGGAALVFDVRLLKIQ